MKYCSNCGKEMSMNSNFCSNCGSKNVEININQNKKNIGSGKSISSMVLGIIAVVWAFMSLVSLENIGPEIKKLSTASDYVGFFIGYNLFSLPTAIVGLSLGISSKLKNGKKRAGIVMCIISLVIVLINLLVMLSKI